MDNEKILEFESKDNEQVKSAVDGVEDEIPDELAAMASLGSFLALDEERFAILAPVVLEQLERSLQNTNVRRSLYISFISSGGDMGNIRDFYADLANVIEEEVGELSEQKKDFLKVMVALMINGIETAGAESERLITIPIERLNDEVRIPTYAHDTDAGMDVYALDDYTIAPGETKLIPTGFKVAIPTGYELQVRPKSGRCLKTKLRVANTPGTIDAGYRDEVGVIIENVEPPIKDITYEFDENGRPIITSILHGASYTIGKGEKFAQLVLSAVPKATFKEVSKITEAGDRKGGFGSSSIYAKDDSRYGSDLGGNDSREQNKN